MNDYTCTTKEHNNLLCYFVYISYVCNLCLFIIILEILL